MRNDDPAARPPIFLIGMPGSGKSTVGRRIASRLRRPFIDADKELESRCGVPIATIFEVEGEDGFRRREAALIDELSARADMVVATGGGAVLLAENRHVMRERTLVVYLEASLTELWHRLRNDRKRPLLQTEDPRARLSELMRIRTPLYESVGGLRVRSARQSADRLAVDIIERLGPVLGRGASPPAEAPAGDAPQGADTTAPPEPVEPIEPGRP